MYLVDKYKKHGLKWFIRRVVREFINPTTKSGHYLQPISFFIYYVINKPIDFFCYLEVKYRKTADDSLSFFYDLNVDPVTYYFAWVLSHANAYLNQLNLTTLNIIFIQSSANDLQSESVTHAHLDRSTGINWPIYSILFPMTKLLSCAYSITCCSREEAEAIKNKSKYIYSSVQGKVQESSFVSFRAEPQAMEFVSDWVQRHAQNRKVVVITLCYHTDPMEQCNSILAWTQFAQDIDQEKYYIVFILDTEQILSEIPDELKDFDVFEAAAWSVLLRSALYEVAYLNLGINSAPMSLCWLNSSTRYVIFKNHEPKAHVDYGLFENNLFFSNPCQKWVVKNDNFEILCHEFKLMCALIESTNGRLE